MLKSNGTILAESFDLFLRDELMRDEDKSCCVAAGALGEVNVVMMQVSIYKGNEKFGLLSSRRESRLDDWGRAMSEFGIS